MVPRREGCALIRPVAHALICTGFLAGCSPGLTLPSIDPLPVLPAHPGATDRPSLPAASLVGPTFPAVPPAGDGAVRPTSFDGATLPALVLTEAVRFGLQNNPRLRAALAAIERTRGQEAVAFAPF